MPFDRSLSLAIDATHDRLDRLCGERGLCAWLARVWLRWKLRWLERRIPR
jgi:hypothetical protein